MLFDLQMRTSVKKDGLGNNSTQSVPVQPTKQAQSATVPSSKAIQQPQYFWNRLHRRELERATFSECLEMYLVRINGSHRNSYTSVSQDSITVELLYEELHPYLAIGHAVIDFMNDKTAAQIYDIYICKRTIKKTQLTK